MNRKGIAAHRGRRMSEAEFRRLWLSRDVTMEDIARIIGTTASAVYWRAHVRGLGSKPRARKLEWTAEMTAMWHAGVCSRDMAAAAGVAPSTISRRAKAAGMPPRCTGYRPLMTLAEWREAQMAERMRAVAERESAIERKRRDGRLAA
jgi:hypothetical protein